MSDATDLAACGSCPFLLYCSTTLFNYGNRGRLLAHHCDHCTNNVLVVMEDPQSDAWSDIGWCSLEEYERIRVRCDQTWVSSGRPIYVVGLHVLADPECSPDDSDLICPDCAKWAAENPQTQRF